MSVAERLAVRETRDQFTQKAAKIVVGMRINQKPFKAGKMPALPGISLNCLCLERKSLTASSLTQ